jgi:hypothetical protein
MAERTDPIQEINCLWDLIYPYLAIHIHEVYGRKDGRILEIGPFCGAIFALVKQGIGSSFSIATFPPGMGDFFRQEARRRKMEGKINIIETDSALTGIEVNKFDLVVFRGAFFFPSLFQVNFLKIHRLLRLNGIALMGGGFGKFTPDNIIKEIWEKSRDLNLQIGKTEVQEDQLRKDLKKSRVKASVEIHSEGGLWMVMRK